MKKIIYFVLMGTALCFLAGCGNSGTSGSAKTATESAGIDVTEESEKLTDATASGEATQSLSSLSYVAIGAGATGGNFYMTTSAFCQAYNERISGTTCNAETTSGSTENNKMLIDGDLQMAITNVDSAYCASKGTREFDDGVYSSGADIVIVLPGDWNNLLNIIVRDDSGITDISQLKGKTIACNSGSQMTDYTPLVLAAYGMEEGEYTITAVTTSEMADAMRDKQVDAIMQFGAPPTSAFADLASTTDVTWLNIDEEHMKKIIDEYPYFNSAVLPAGTYNGQDEDVNVLANMPVFEALANLDEEFVYEFVKCMIENNEDISIGYAGCANYNLENLKDYYDTGALSLHDGSIRYLKEAGAID